jgi:hypothetical protein
MTPYPSSNDSDVQGYRPEDADQDRGHKDDRGVFTNCPTCPDLKKKIDRIDLALMGPDGTGMKEGIVQAITQLQKNSQVQNSWINFGKPIMIALVTSTVTFLLTYGILERIL